MNDTLPEAGTTLTDGFVVTKTTVDAHGGLVMGVSRQGGLWRLILSHGRWTCLRGTLGCEGRITNLSSFDDALRAVRRCEAGIEDVLTTRQVQTVVMETAERFGMEVREEGPWAFIMHSAQGCVAIEASFLKYPIVSVYPSKSFREVKGALDLAFSGLSKTIDGSPAFRRPPGEPWSPYTPSKD